MKITGINFNWYSTPENGEEFSSRHVGFNCHRDIMVERIEEHPARGDGDRWFYDVFLYNGTMERIFNPNMVFYAKEESE